VSDEAKVVCNGSYKPPNPVHQHDDGTWWFCNEVWADESGPYSSKEAVEAALANYCKEVLGV
jgi:hypothetical protein